MTKIIKQLKEIKNTHYSYKASLSQRKTTYQDYLHSIEPVKPVEPNKPEFPIELNKTEEEGLTEVRNKNYINYRGKSGFVVMIVFGAIFIGLVTPISYWMYGEILGTFMVIPGVALLVCGIIFFNKCRAKERKNQELIEKKCEEYKTTRMKLTEQYEIDCKNFELETEKYQKDLDIYLKEKEKFDKTSYKKDYDDFIKSAQKKINHHLEACEIIRTYSNLYNHDEVGLKRINRLIEYLEEGSADNLKEAIKILRQEERDQNIVEQKRQIEEERSRRELEAENRQRQFEMDKLKKQEEIEKMKIQEQQKIIEQQARNQEALYKKQKEDLREAGRTQCFHCKRHSSCSYSVQENNNGNCPSYIPK